MGSLRNKDGDGTVQEDGWAPESEEPTLNAIARELRRHQDECAKQTERTRKVIEAQGRTLNSHSTLLAHIDKKIDGLDTAQKKAWDDFRETLLRNLLKVVGAVCLAVFVTGLGVVATNLTAHNGATAQAAAIAATLADKTTANVQTADAQQKEILKEIRTLKH